MVLPSFFFVIVVFVVACFLSPPVPWADGSDVDMRRVLTGDDGTECLC